MQFVVEAVQLVNRLISIFIPASVNPAAISQAIRRNWRSRVNTPQLKNMHREVRMRRGCNRTNYREHTPRSNARYSSYFVLCCSKLDRAAPCKHGRTLFHKSPIERVAERKKKRPRFTPVRSIFVCVLHFFFFNIRRSSTEAHVRTFPWIPLFARGKEMGIAERFEIRCYARETVETRWTLFHGIRENY